MDAAHRATDKELERIEKKLTEIYKQASNELGEKADKYFERFKELDQQKRALVKAGKMTEAEYKKWRHGKIMTGEHWKQMQKQAAQRLTEADRIAAEYTNGRLPYVYSLNYNSVAEGLETRLKGYSFELVDEATVRNLAMSDKTLLPYKVVDGKKAERWHTARVNAEVIQGILQGESIPKIAKRLKTNVGMTAKGSAVRNARTTVTSAENKGRIDMLHDAREKGVIAHKIWLAAHDSRTREAHAELDGEEAEEEEYFTNSIGEILYPGDPDAAPANVYNCRCSLTYKVVGFGKQSTTNEPTFNFGEMDAEIAEEHERAIRNVMEEYPLQNIRLESVTDFRTAWGLPNDTDLIDFTDEHTEWEGVGAIFYPDKTKYPGGMILDGPHIVTYASEEYDTMSMKDYLSALADIRERNGWNDERNSFFNAGGGIEAAMVHEYGHAVALDRGLYAGGKRYSELENIFNNYTQQEIGRYITTYASTNPQEMFAEAFVLSHEPRLRNKLIDELMGLL